MYDSLMCVCVCECGLSLWQLFGWLNHDKMEDHFGAIYGFLMAIHQEVVEQRHFWVMRQSRLASRCSPERIFTQLKPNCIFHSQDSLLRSSFMSVRICVIFIFLTIFTFLTRANRACVNLSAFFITFHLINSTTATTDTVGQSEHTRHTGRPVN